MVRYFIYCLVLIAFVAVLAGPRTTPNAISAPQPTPVGLQYDEMTKMAMPPATPVPPGSFHDDFVAAMNSPNGGLPEGMDADAIAAAARMGIKIPAVALGGVRPMRYAFYNGWIRVDDLLAKTAEIQKCNQHQFIRLDLNKKTYRISSASNVQASAGSYSGGTGREAPGTAQMTISSKSTNLGPKTLESIPTRGYNLVNSMAITQATGSCQNGSFSSTQVEYVSNIHQPKTFCELPTVNAMGRASGGGGCSPTMHYSGGGSGPAADRLVMYARTEMSAGGGMAPATVLERGNVKWLYLPDATALFTIPSDFTQER